MTAKVRGVVARVTCTQCGGRGRVTNAQGERRVCTVCTGKGERLKNISLAELRELLEIPEPVQITGRPLPSVKDVLEELGQLPPKTLTGRRTTFDTILAVVAEESGVSLLDLVGNRRARSYVRARHVAMWFCREKLSMSYPEVARLFRGRDHTSVMSACRKVEARASGGALDDIFERVARRLGVGP